MLEPPICREQKHITPNGDAPLLEKLAGGVNLFVADRFASEAQHTWQENRECRSMAAVFGGYKGNGGSAG
jgi:hypothetical protein